jgi:hypothetical protein
MTYEASSFSSESLLAAGKIAMQAPRQHFRSSGWLLTRFELRVLGCELLSAWSFAGIFPMIASSGRRGVSCMGAKEPKYPLRWCTKCQDREAFHMFEQRIVIGEILEEQKLGLQTLLGNRKLHHFPRSTTPNILPFSVVKDETKGPE